jgi:hypothetical protein
VSLRNGDKARFGRLRKRKILLRKRIREMRDAMENKTTGTAIPGRKQDGPTSQTLEPIG